VDVFRFNHGKSSDGELGRHERTWLGASAGSHRIPHLHRFASDAHNGALLPEQLIVGVSGISHRFGRAFVALTIAVTDGYELWHCGILGDEREPGAAQREAG